MLTLSRTVTTVKQKHTASVRSLVPLPFFGRARIQICDAMIHPMGVVQPVSHSVIGEEFFVRFFYILNVFLVNSFSEKLVKNTKLGHVVSHFMDDLFVRVIRSVTHVILIVSVLQLLQFLFSWSGLFRWFFL